MKIITYIKLAMLVIYRILPLVLGIFALFFMPSVIKAQAPCTGVDLVFVVDNSGSMERNDPGDLRVDGVRFAIDGLGNNILYDCPSAIHRLAVVGFGDASGGAQDTEIYLENALIAPQLEEFRTWVATREQYKNAIPKPSPYLGATDFLSAFQTAAGILARWQEQPPNGAARLRGVVLVADGGPCVIDLGCTTSGNSMNVANYLGQLETYLDPNGDTFPWRGNGHPSSVQIWFIAFNDTTAGAAYNYLNPDTAYGQMLQRSWTTITEGHGGYMAILRSSGPNDGNANRDIGLRIAEIVDAITGSELIPTNCKEPFYVNPYLGRIIIRILKIGSNPDVPLENVKVDVVYEGPLAAARFARGDISGAGGIVSDYRADGPNEYYVIENPAPGTWRIEVEGADECRDLDVRYNEIPIQGQVIAPALDATLPQYDEGDSYDPNDPLYFEYRLYRSQTSSAPEETLLSLPEFPLTITVNMTNSNQQVQQLTLEQQTNGNWRSTEPIKTAVAGRYTWSLAAQALNGERSTTLTRFPASGSFTVKAVKRFHLELVEPKAQTTVSLNDFEDGTVVATPVRVLAKVIDDTTGQVLSQEAIAAMSATEPLLNVVVSTANGTSQPVAMTYDATLGGWLADLLAGQDGIPAVPGNHAITVQLNRNAYNQEQYRPALQNGSASSVTIKRTIVMDGAILQPQASAPIPQFDEGEQFDPEAPIFLAYALHGWKPQSATNGLSFSQYPVQLRAEIYFDDQLHQTVSLASQDDGNWLATEPLKVPYAGEYHWKLMADPAREEDKDLIIGFTREGTFVVNKVGRFHLEVLEPQGNVYPINRFYQGQQEILPLPIAVALVDDESGAYLAPEQLTEAISTTPTLSATIRLGGVQSRPIALAYNPTNKHWEAAVVAGDASVPEAAGHYTLQVDFSAMTYDKTRYRPSVLIANQDTVQFERTRITPVMLQVEQEAIVQPAHEGSMGCIDATVKPLQIRLQALNAQTKQLLDPMEITGGKASLLALVTMINPAANVPVEEGSWELVQTSSGAELQASLGMTYTQAGRYAIQIMPNPTSLADNFQFFDEEDDLLVAVNRTYNLWNDPKTCQRTQTAGVSVLALFFLWMGSNWWRRPTGYLQVIESRSGNTVAEQRLGRSLLLLFRPRESLSFNFDPDIAKLVVQKARGDQVSYADPFADQTGERTGKRAKTRAVKVTVYDPQRNVLLDPTLAPGGDPYPISPYLEVRYS